MITTYRGLPLDAFQQEAMAAIARGDNVVVAAPTGAGKTLIAHYAIEHALARGERVIYTAPIKALSNQKYRDLSEAHPGKVGISTGDVSIDAGAPVVIMTTEIFRNTIFDDPERAARTGWVIFDEVHYLDDRERGTVWEESLIFAPPSVKVLALSATVSNLVELTDWMREVRDRPVQVVLETNRPVPLDVSVWSTEGELAPLRRVDGLRLGARGFRGRFENRARDLRGYYERAQERLVQAVSERDELPLLFFLFSRGACERLATAVAQHHDLSKSPAAGRAARAEFDRLAAAFELDLADPELRQLGDMVQRGVAYHHAGILPALKEVIERLFSGGQLRLLCATETFALGVNMPARSVAFEGIMRWNGKARVPLLTREYQQMAGRAGRRGIDPRGAVYVTFDPFRDDPRTVRGIVDGKVEPVRSQFNLSYGTLLNLYERLGDDLYEACERSFANFRARRRGGGSERRGGPQRERQDAARAEGERHDGAPAEDEASGSGRFGVVRGRVHRAGREQSSSVYELAVSEGRRARAEGRRDDERGRHREPGRRESGESGRRGGRRDRSHGSGRHESGRRESGESGRHGDERGRHREPGRRESGESGRHGGKRGRRHESGESGHRGRGRRGRRERHEERGLPAPPRRDPYEGIVEQVRLKMQLLAELGYIDAEGQITRSGHFAKQVFGHELELSELLFSGALTGLTAEQVAVVAAAVVFESRTNTYYGGPEPRSLVGKHTYRLAETAVGGLVRREEQGGIRQPCKALDWNLSGAVWAWVQGAEFAELRELSDASDGDVVRSLRQTIQLLRLAVEPLRALGEEELAQRFAAAQRLLKRDQVDAEWQLRRAAELAGLDADDLDEHGDDEHGDDEHGGDERGGDERGDDERGDDEHGDDEHGGDERGDDEHLAGQEGKEPGAAAKRAALAPKVAAAEPEEDEFSAGLL
ncbi:MAG: DEAD/DEAH box helicase [Planctomycetota bacterium]